MTNYNTYQCLINSKRTGLTNIIVYAASIEDAKLVLLSKYGYSSDEIGNIQCM